MKINLRILCCSDARAVPAKDRTVAQTCDLDSVVFDITSEDKILDRILDLMKNCFGSWFNPIMNFTKREMSQARYFQVDCRKTIHETAHDYELNLARLEALEFIRTTGQCKIKLLDEVRLSQIKLKPVWLPELMSGHQNFLLPLLSPKYLIKSSLQASP